MWVVNWGEVRMVDGMRRKLAWFYSVARGCESLATHWGATDWDFVAYTWLARIPDSSCIVKAS